MKRQLSYWERDVLFADFDVAIVGAGLVGLSIAISLLESDPKLRVAVLDRETLSYGASSRNAGFACFGSLSEILESIRLLGSKEPVLQLTKRRIQGLELLLNRFGRDTLEYKPCGGYELFRNSDTKLLDSCLSFLDEWNEALASVTNCKACFSDASHQISQFGFSGIEHMLFNSQEGAINPGKLMQALHKKANTLGAIFFAGLKVENYLEKEKVIEVITEQGFSLEAKKIAFANNAFASKFFPEEIIPARAQVLISKKLPFPLPFHGTFHMEEGYYYFRDVDNRVLLGGARHKAKDEERTDKIALNNFIQEHLDTILKEHILPGKEIEVDMRWSGIMAMSPQKTGAAMLNKVSERVFVAARLSGMGIALGSLLAQETAVEILSG